jgi:hypothetical protein
MLLVPSLIQFRFFSALPEYLDIFTGCITRTSEYIVTLSCIHVTKHGNTLHFLRIYFYTKPNYQFLINSTFSLFYSTFAHLKGNLQKIIAD